MGNPISRVELPTEFFDITSAMMLAQPEPEYSFAKMLFAASARAELMAGEASSTLMSLGLRGPGGSGAAYSDLRSQQLELASNMLATAITVVPELGKKGVGHTIKMNRPAFASSTYTQASRIVNGAISTTPVSVSGEQVSITIQRFIGPYSGSAPAPYAIERADAQRSVHQLAGIVGLHLQRDRMKFVDTVVATLLDQPVSTQIYRPAGVTADASFPASGEVAVDLETLFRAEEGLKAANIPRFADGSYAAVVSPRQMRQLKTDPDFKALAVFLPSQNPLQIASIAKVGNGITLIESNTVITDTTTVPGQTIQHGVMFGPGAVGYGIDEACRVASANEDNYGETSKVIWIAYEGFQLLDNRFVAGIRSI